MHNRHTQSLLPISPLDFSRAAYHPDDGDSTHSETSVYLSETTRHYVPEGCHICPISMQHVY